MRLMFVCLFYSAIGFAQQWEELTAFPGPGRDDAIGFSIGEYIYLTTGNHGGFSESNRTYRCQSDFSSWEEVSPFGGIPRQYATAFSLNGKGYVVGGTSETGQALNDCWSYDPQNDNWEQLANFPGPAHWGASATSTASAGFLAGGTDGNTVFNQFWMYTAESDTWEVLPSLPGSGSREGVLVAVPNKLIYAGGFRISPLECLTETYLYDLSSHSWTAGTSIPGNQSSYLTGTPFGNQALLAGGWSCDGNFTAAAWLTDGITWEVLPELPFTGIRGMAACTVNGQALFFSGLLENNQRSTQVSRFGDPMSLDDAIIYPNPSSGHVTFCAPQKTELRILTSSGKLVMETNFTETFLFLNTSFDQGIYLVEYLLNGQKRIGKMIITG